MLGETGKNSFGVVRAADLDQQVELGHAHRDVVEPAFVIDLDDIAAEPGDLLGDPGQASRLVGD